MVKQLLARIPGLSIARLVAGKPNNVARSIRMTSNVQITMITLPTLLMPNVLLVEPPETHLYSVTAYLVNLGMLLWARWQLFRNHTLHSATVTLASVVIHISAIAVANPNDPAYFGFALMTILAFLVFTPRQKMQRWFFVVLSSILLVVHQLYFRVLGHEGVFSAATATVAGDFYMPPLILLTVFLSLLLYQFVKAVDTAEAALEAEHAKSEALLLNILPATVAAELKSQGASPPRHYDSATVCFTDFVGFTKIAETMTPAELVAELDRCFSHFDTLMERYGLEKLKTIGDSYMFVGGIPNASTNHAERCVSAALDIQDFMNSMKAEKQKRGLPYWELRLGIHSGDLVAGVIGHKKFAYDVWSDTVNTASRCESSGVAGKINISQSTYELIKDQFHCEHRGAVAAKSKGELDMYFVTGRR